MKNKEIVFKLYQEISKDKNFQKNLKKKLINYNKFDKSFITKNILPLAKKLNLNVTWQDIFEYEKNSISNDKILNEDDLSNVAGGKALNAILSCGLLATMGLTGISVNPVSADFIQFVATKEARDAVSGNLPFYLQADHPVDGILWFKAENKNSAFFIIERKISDGRLMKYFTENYDEIKNNEYKLLNIDELSSTLKKSYEQAQKVGFKEPVGLSIFSDNPLYNFARFYNPNYIFDEKAKRSNLEEIKMYIDSDIKIDENKTFSHLEWSEELKKSPKKLSYANEIFEKLLNDVSFNIVHRVESEKQPEFKTIESSYNLNRYYNRESAHTGDEDKNTLRNDGFTFFTLQVNDKESIPEMFEDKKNLYESQVKLENIPLVSCSKDMLPRLNPEANSGLSGLFSETDELPDPFPCFNGSSESVKKLVLKYYTDEAIKGLSEEDCVESNKNEHIESIIQKIGDDALEVRVPTKFNVENWTKVK